MYASSIVKVRIRHAPKSVSSMGMRSPTARWTTLQRRAPESQAENAPRSPAEVGGRAAAGGEGAGGDIGRSGAPGSDAGAEGSANGRPRGRPRGVRTRGLAVLWAGPERRRRRSHISLASEHGKRAG